MNTLTVIRCRLHELTNVVHAEDSPEAGEQSHETYTRNLEVIRRV